MHATRPTPARQRSVPSLSQWPFRLLPPLLLAAFLLTAVGLALAAPGPLTPPDPPIIREPATDGQIVNPADVHMESAPINDPDGDGHHCSDWQIVISATLELVWRIDCTTGPDKTHAHLGDGAFVNSYAGRTELEHDRDYWLRVRYRDDSPAQQWSGWSERLFRTGPATQVFPLQLDDIADFPAPGWAEPDGTAVVLPGGASPPALLLESAAGQLLLQITGLDGVTNTVANPGPLPAHAAVRVQISGGGGGLLLPETDLTFADPDGQPHTIFLPAVTVTPTQSIYLWVSANGSTYYGQAGQTAPDFSALARGAAVPWAVFAAGYRVEIFATGFRLPTHIAFIPEGVYPGEHDDPLFYVTELYGDIKLVAGDGDVLDYATGLLNFNPTGGFPGSGELGLAGVVVDPANGDVYASMLYSSDPTDPNAPFYAKVDRFQSVDGGQTALTRTTVLDLYGETMWASHQISNLTFGPDDKLYVHMGDGFDPSQALNLDSFRGKILRVNRDGSPPPDNPFYDASNGINARDYLYAYGFRNPFGGAWREADGRLYVPENGPSVDRLSRILPGASYGWDGSDGSMFINAIYNWDPSHAPVALAYIQPGLFGGSGFDASRMDQAFVTESGPTWATGPQTRGKRIVAFDIDANGGLVSGPTTFVEYNGSGKASAAGMAAGPDGLYFSDLYKDLNYAGPTDRGANILRIKYVGQADFSAAPVSGPAPLAVQFADLSTVPNANAWQWDFGDGGTSTAQNPVHVYTAPGVYDVRLNVTGPNGMVSAFKADLVNVQNTAPAANAGPDQTAVVATAVQLDGSGSSDPNGHALSFGWQQTGGAPVTLSDPAAVQPTFTAPDTTGQLTFQLVVTDAYGLASPPDDVTITVENDAPAANAGPDQTAVVATAVQLDGSGSSDPNGHALSFGWQQTGGAPVTLSDPAAVQPTFTAPDTTGQLTFQLVVTDAYGLASPPDTVSVLVTNNAPRADAGPDQTVVISAAVTLDGRASADPDGHALSFDWQQIGGPPVTLSDPTSAQPTFIAPATAVTLTFRLLVTDRYGLPGTPDDVSVFVVEKPPTWTIFVPMVGEGTAIGDLAND